MVALYEFITWKRQGGILKNLMLRIEESNRKEKINKTDNIRDYLYEYLINDRLGSIIELNQTCIAINNKSYKTTKIVVHLRNMYIRMHYPPYLVCGRNAFWMKSNDILFHAVSSIL